MAHAPDRGVIGATVSGLMMKCSPKLGFGVSGPLAAAWHNERSAMTVLERAVESGVRRFDTAGFYGEGVGEIRLGRVLRGLGDPVVISTKVGKTAGRLGPGDRAFAPDMLRQQIEQSLARLGVSTVEIVYLHGPMPDELVPALDVLNRLKEEGHLRRVGVCSMGVFVDQAIDANVDAIMAPFNFLNHMHGAAFNRAQAQGMHISAITPLAQGLYAPKFWRMRAPADVWRIARSLVKFPHEYRAARHLQDRFQALGQWDPPDAALAYVLGDPRISDAVATTTRLDHLDALIAAGRRSLTAEERSAMDAMRVEYQLRYHATARPSDAQFGKGSDRRKS